MPARRAKTRACAERALRLFAPTDWQDNPDKRPRARLRFKVYLDSERWNIVRTRVFGSLVQAPAAPMSPISDQQPQLRIDDAGRRPNEVATNRR